MLLSKQSKETNKQPTKNTRHTTEPLNNTQHTLNTQHSIHTHTQHNKTTMMDDSITEHRFRTASRIDRSSTKYKRRQSRHLNTYPLHGPVPRKAWARRSTSHKGGTGARRHRRESAVAEEPLDCGMTRGYYYASNGKRVLKKKTLPTYTKRLERQNIQEDDYERKLQYLYEESQMESTPPPEAVLHKCPRTHTQEEWESTFRTMMIHAGYQQQISTIQSELTTSNRLYEDMANHARRSVIALDKATDELVTLRQEMLHWKKKYVASANARCA